MRKYFGVLGVCFFALQLTAQQKCVSSEYLNKQLANDPSSQNKIRDIENYTQQKTGKIKDEQRIASPSHVIKIPVIFHVLYHLPQENVSQQKIADALAILNRDFRRKNADTINTPSFFKPLAADMEIEFKLAISDSRGVSTNGVVRKYTPIKYWLSDDKIKSNATSGDDPWDSKSYLNIWICNMEDILGYSAFPGLDPKLDGIVINYKNIIESGSSLKNQGRTFVHEVGHWLNLKHIWGETFCGDDGVDDTPKQSSYTPGCPSGVRVSCSNNSNGDMYMNYMDFTDDACMNMFSNGQKQRARVLFETGGARNSILTSKGLNDPSIYAAALPDFYPKWLNAQVYPNPANSLINIYFDYDQRWMGKELFISDMMGRQVMKKIINSKIQQIDISKLQPGIYFLKAIKDDESLVQKFIKL